MSGASVADIVKGKHDATGEEILCVYAKVLRRYAVYRTAQRVMIQHADDQDMGAEQRAAIAPLNPVRGQINGLIDGWRGNRDPKAKAKAALFDRRVADALCLGLQGQVDHAELLLREIKDEVLEKRTAPARVNYILVAAATALVLMLVAAIATSTPYRTLYAYSAQGWDLWLGAGAGALGALFSTGIAMRTRAILTDLEPVENRADAAARVAIGAIAGMVLVGLITAGNISLSFGETGLSARGPNAWIGMAAAGFAAGFLERLVPGLLEGSAISGRTGSATNSLAGGTPPAGAMRGATGASEQHPLGRPQSPVNGRAVETRPAAAEGEPAPGEPIVPPVQRSGDEANGNARQPAPAEEEAPPAA